jgi:hypothetical protein
MFLQAREYHEANPSRPSLRLKHCRFNRRREIIRLARQNQFIHRRSGKPCPRAPLASSRKANCQGLGSFDRTSIFHEVHVTISVFFRGPPPILDKKGLPLAVASHLDLGPNKDGETKIRIECLRETIAEPRGSWFECSSMSDEVWRRGVLSLGVVIATYRKQETR